MVFKKYHCSKCGGKLEKEKTHRVVTKDDKDYYQYHDVGTYPRRDYDVYEYRFQCPACHARISYEEQCILKRIQKKQRRLVLSPSQIKDNYQEYKLSNQRRALASNLCIPMVFLSIIFALYYFLATDRTRGDLGTSFILFLIFTTVIIVNEIRKYKGNHKLRHKRSYSYETESRLKKLHAYSSYNRKLVDVADQCYCFYCQNTMDAGEIEDYADDGQTAICPKCGIDSILPDSIEEALDANTIAEMNEYWF